MQHVSKTAQVQWIKGSAPECPHPPSNPQDAWCTQYTQHSTAHKKFIYMQGAQGRKRV